MKVKPELRSNLLALTLCMDATSLCVLFCFVFTHLSSFSSSSHLQHTKHSRRESPQKQTLGATVTKWGRTHAEACLSFCLFLISVNWSFSFCSKMDKCRTETGAADMPPCQRRRRTWRCSGGEGLSSVIKLHGRWAVNGVTSSSAGRRISLLSPGRNHSSDLSFFFAFVPCLAADTWWTSCWRPRGPTWRSCSACCRCVSSPAI